jgi:transposase-like protein
MLAERGIKVSYETIRCWTIKFGPLIAANLRRRRTAPTGRSRLKSGKGWAVPHLNSVNLTRPQ